MGDANKVGGRRTEIAKQERHEQRIVSRERDKKSGRPSSSHPVSLSNHFPFFCLGLSISKRVPFGMTAF